MIKAFKFLAGTFTSSQNINYPTTLSKKWAWVSGIIAVLVSIPILAVLSSFFVSSGEIWDHLVDTVLGDYVANSFFLIIFFFFRSFFFLSQNRFAVCFRVDGFIPSAFHHQKNQCTLRQQGGLVAHGPGGPQTA